MKTVESIYTCDTMNMVIELTNACDLRCRYCFEKCQTEDRKFSVMSKEVLKASIDFLFEGRDNCHLTFFGGEPTLCKEHIAYGIQYANKVAHQKKKYIAYSIVTNGTQMDDDFIELLNWNNVNVVFSFDGNKLLQNKYRPFANGEGSYDVVLSNLGKLLASRRDG